MSLSLEELTRAVSFDSRFASISIDAELRAVGPQGGKVAPPTFPPTAARNTPYLVDQRWIDGDARTVVTLDTPQAQANRCEGALRDALDDGLVDLPVFEIEVDVETDAGVRRPRLTSLDFPHRYADAYLRDTTLDGVAFDKSEIGKALQLSEQTNARALYEHEPYSLVYGAWNSHRKGRQAKFPRIYDSSIIGLDPKEGVRAGGRLDPVNLTGAFADSVDDWAFVAEGQKKKGSRLSEIGHGNALDSGGAHGHMAITGARRLAILHLSALSGIRFGSEVSPEAQTAGRAALVALALLGDRLAFGRPSVFLRSGCDLVVVEERIAFENPSGEDEVVDLGVREAIELFKAAVQRAAELGLKMRSDRMRVEPKSGLADAIRHAYAKAAPAADS